MGTTLPGNKVTPVKPKIVPLGVNTGENTVEFNRYMIVYSNNFTGNLSSRWRAGMTGISCYKDTQFVGAVYFYPDPASMPASYKDPDGVLCLNYPLSSFHDALSLLEQKGPLCLLLVERDEQNNPLNPPVGAIMTAVEMVS
jgi:hypothetical protein